VLLCACSAAPAATRQPPPVADREEPPVAPRWEHPVAPPEEPPATKRIIVTSMVDPIVQYVRFARGASTIGAEYVPLVDEIARLLEQHPEIERLAIIGHASKDEPNAL